MSSTAPSGKPDRSRPTYGGIAKKRAADTNRKAISTGARTLRPVFAEIDPNIQSNPPPICRGGRPRKDQNAVAHKSRQEPRLLTRLKERLQDARHTRAELEQQQQEQDLNIMQGAQGALGGFPRSQLSPGLSQSTPDILGLSSQSTVGKSCTYDDPRREMDRHQEEEGTYMLAGALGGFPSSQLGPARSQSTASTVGLGSQSPPWNPSVYDQSPRKLTPPVTPARPAKLLRVEVPPPPPRNLSFIDIDDIPAPPKSPSPPPSPSPPERRPRRRRSRRGRPEGAAQRSTPIARTPGRLSSPHRLPPLKTARNCCPHCFAYLWKEERPTNDKNSWSCCSNSAVDTPCPEYQDPHGPRQRGVEQATTIDKLIFDLELPLRQEHRRDKLTKECRQFREKIVAYNNAASFASEGIDKVDRSNSAFTLKIQGNMYHCIGSLFPEENARPRFAQIWIWDNSQEALEHRLAHNAGLESRQLHQVQTFLRRINPFATALRDCATRLRADMESSQARVVLHQMDPKRAERGINNHPQSDEVASILYGHDLLDYAQKIERDIVIQSIEGGLQRISYAHTCYMPLRYPLIFVHGEPGWRFNIPLQGNSVSAIPDGHVLSERNRNRNPRRLLNTIHGQEPRRPPPEPEDSDGESEIDDVMPPLRQTVRGPTTGRGGSKSISLNQMYKKMIQVRLFP